MVALLLLACGDPEPLEGSGERAADYLPVEGQFSTFIPADNPDGPTLWMLAEAETWTFKLGPRWADASDWAVWRIVSEEGLAVNDQTLLPSRPIEGWVSESEATTITTIGEAEAWYGTFPVAAVVETEGDTLAGEQVLAVGLGLVVFEVGGKRWELAYYE